MKVCHVTCVHPRYDVRIFEKECQSLARSGYEVSLVVNDDKQDEEKDRVKIVTTGFLPQNRRERFVYSPRLVLKKALEVNAEIYHLHDPELLRIAKKLKKLGKKVIFDAHEDVEAQIMDKEWIPRVLRGLVSKFYASYSHSIMRKVDGLISVTPAIVEKYKKYNSNIVMVTNYPIISECKFDSTENIGECQYVFFAGGISKQWCHNIITEATRRVESVEYYFAGRGEEEYIDEMCANGAKYLGVLPHSDVAKYYANALAGMAVLQCTQVGNEGTLGNTKLFEVMQAGKPVICSDLHLWKDIVDEYNCGICVNPDSINEISEAIEYLVENPMEAQKMGDNGKRAVNEKYNWKTQEEHLLELYQKI